MPNRPVSPPIMLPCLDYQIGQWSSWFFHLIGQLISSLSMVVTQFCSLRWSPCFFRHIGHPVRSSYWSGSYIDLSSDRSPCSFIWVFILCWLYCSFIWRITLSFSLISHPGLVLFSWFQIFGGRCYCNGRRLMRVYFIIKSASRIGRKSGNVIWLAQQPVFA